MSDPIDSIRVLHVDDDPALCDIVATFLERAGERLEVVSETDPADALERLEREDIDCVVSDYDMPGMTGIEFLRAVRESHPDLPFVLFTGKGSEEVAGDAISAGTTDYLRKEAGTDQYTVLANRIENAVAHRRARDRLRRLERRKGRLESVAAEAARELEAALDDAERHLDRLAATGDEEHVRALRSAQARLREIAEELDELAGPDEFLRSASPTVPADGAVGLLDER